MLYIYIIYIYFFFVSVCPLRSKGQSLRCSPGWGNSHHCGNKAACSTLCQLAVTSPSILKQIGPFWC